MRRAFNDGSFCYAEDGSLWAVALGGQRLGACRGSRSRERSPADVDSLSRGERYWGPTQTTRKLPGKTEV